MKIEANKMINGKANKDENFNFKGQKLKKF